MLEINYDFSLGLTFFNEIFHVGTIEVTKDEFPRPGCTLDGFQKLRPAFIKNSTGTVTAGNASG